VRVALRPAQAGGDLVTCDPIDVLRDQLAGLISQIDSSHKPRPDEIVAAGDRNPGPVWHPAGRWTVRALTDDEMPPTCVFITSPEHFKFDFDALRTGDARKLAMAILAAADWADGLAAGVTQLDGRRTDLTSKETSR
jgi:hypothetical protein